MRSVVGAILLLALVPSAAAEDDDGAQYPLPVTVSSDEGGTFVQAHDQMSPHDLTWSGGERIYIDPLLCELSTIECP